MGAAGGAGVWFMLAGPTGWVSAGPNGEVGEGFRAAKTFGWRATSGGMPGARRSPAQGHPGPPAHAGPVEN